METSQGEPRSPEQGVPRRAEMAGRVGALDWAQTPLGPVDAWPQSLRTATQMVLAAPFATILLWGPDLIQIYNDGYRALMGNKHPAGLGQPTRNCWPEVWHLNEPLYARVWQGASFSLEDKRLSLTHSGVRQDAWFTPAYSPVRDEAGTVAGVLVTFFETTERPKIEKALRESQERQAFLLTLSDALRPLADPMQIQDAACRLLGHYLAADRVNYAEIEGKAHAVTREHRADGLATMTGRDATARIRPAERAAFEAGHTVTVADTEADPTLTAGEIAAYRASGVRAFVSVPLRKTGRLRSVFSVIRSRPGPWAADEVALITEVAERTWAAVERARAEQALRESEEQYRSLFSSVDEGLCTIEVLFDETGTAVDYRFLETNPAFERQTGLVNVVGKTMRACVPQLEEFWYELYGRIVRTGEAIRFENEVAAFGKTYDIYAFRVGAASETRVAVLFKDITERKRAEEAVRQSEERFRLFVNASSDIIYRMNADWSEMRTLDGKGFLADTRNLSLTWLEEYIPDSDKATVQAAIADAVRTKTTFELEHRVRRANNTLGWVFSRAIPFLNARSEIIEWFGAASDITERKRREANLAFLVEMTQDLTPLTNIEDTMNALGAKIGTHFNAFVCAFGEVDEMQQHVTVAYEWRQEDSPSWKGAHRIRDYFYTEDFRRACRAGETYIVRDAAKDERVNAEQMAALSIGSFIGMPLVRNGEWLFNLTIADTKPRVWRDDEIELIQELTARIWMRLERARAEEAVRDSEERLRALIENLPGGAVFVVGKDLRYLIAEGEALAVAGFAPHDLVGRTVGAALSPELVADHEQRYRKALAGEAFEHEHSAHGRDYISRGVPLRAASGAIYAVLAVSYDITERKRAEEALRESEARLRMATEAGRIGTWEWNLQTDEAFWNDQHFRLFEMQPRPNPVNLETFSRHVHPDDRERVSELLNKAVAEKTVYSADFRAVLEGGETRWMSDYGRVTEEAANGEPTKMSGLMFDIHDRKRAEDALRDSEERFRTVSDVVPQLIWTNSADGVANYFNRRWYDYTGLTDAQSAGLGWQAIVHPDDAPASVEKWQRALATGGIFDTEYRLRGGDNSYRWFLGRNIPLKDAAGKVTGWFGTATDIEERKRAEETVRAATEAVARANAELELRVQERTQSLLERTEQLDEMNAMRQELLRQLVTAQEDERGRISRDLHDDTGQQLSALMLGLRGVQDTPRMADDPVLRATLMRLEALAGEVAQKSHRLSFNLRPTALDDQGLMGAMSNYVAEWSQWSRLHVGLESIGLETADKTAARLSREIETTIYRVVQEALTNVLRYAAPTGNGTASGGGQAATQVSILVQRRGNEVLTMIEDNGPGFDVEAVLNQPPGKRRLGIFGMQERARLVGGTLTVESEPGSGTTVYLRLPLP